MTQKDTATIREVFSAITEMRREMQDMRKELRDDFKTMMNEHCDWATKTVEHYDGIAQSIDKRVKTQEEFVANITGKIAVVGGIIMIVTNFLFDVVKEALAKGQ